MDPFWTPLGDPNRPKIDPSRLLKLHFLQKLIFQKNERHCSHSTILRSKSGPRRPQIDPRSPQDGLQELLFSSSFLTSFFVRLWCVFGPILGAISGPLTPPKESIRWALLALKRPKTAQLDSTHLNSPQLYSTLGGSFTTGAPWGGLGGVLSPLGCLLVSPSLHPRRLKMTQGDLR